MLHRRGVHQGVLAEARSLGGRARAARRGTLRGLPHRTGEPPVRRTRADLAAAHDAAPRVLERALRGAAQRQRRARRACGSGEGRLRSLTCDRVVRRARGDVPTAGEASSLRTLRFAPAETWSTRVGTFVIQQTSRSAHINRSAPARRHGLHLIRRVRPRLRQARPLNRLDRRAARVAPSPSPCSSRRSTISLRPARSTRRSRPPR